MKLFSFTLQLYLPQYHKYWYRYVSIFKYIFDVLLIVYVFLQKLVVLSYAIESLESFFSIYLILENLQLLIINKNSVSTVIQFYFYYYAL